MHFYDAVDDYLAFVKKGKANYNDEMMS